MASNTIKGLTVEIGGDTTKLGKALEGVNKKSRDLSSELGEINKLLKLDPGNTQLLAQKQKVLADAVANTADKLDTLKKAEKQVQQQFKRGEVSEEQVRALQREIIATEKKMEGYKKAAKETAKGLDKMDDSTKKVDKSSEGMGSTLGKVAKGGLSVIGGLVAAAGAAMVAAAESSREYRTEMGKLDAAFNANGHSAETATKTYKTLQGVIGETDQSVEAAQQISLLAESEKDAAKWADLAAGVVGQFGDALQPETFYEAANETLKLGEATGAFTQMLEGTGMSVDEFNKGLAACNTEAEKQAYMLQITEKQLGAAGKRYKETNAEVIRANQANEEWAAAMAEVGGAVEPLLSDIKLLGASLVKDLVPGVKEVAGAFRAMLGGDEGAGADLGEALSGIISNLLNKITSVLPQVAEMGVSLTTSLSSSIIHALPQLLDTGVQLAVSLINGLLSAVPQVLAAVTTVIPHLAQSLANGVPQIVMTLVNGLLVAIPQLLAGAVQFLSAIVQAIPMLCQTLAPQIAPIIATICDGLISNIPILLDGALQLLDAIVQAIPVICEALLPEVPRIVQTLTDKLVEMAPMLLDGAITLLFALIDAIPILLDSLLPQIPVIVDSVVQALLKMTPVLLQAAVKLFFALITAVGKIVVELGKQLPNILNVIVSVLSAIPRLLWGIFTQATDRVAQWAGQLASKGAQAAKSLMDKVVNGLKSLPQKILTVGKNLVTGLWDGIKNKADWLKKKIKGWVGDVTKFLKKLFGINSPSKVTSWMGEMLDEGFAKGIEDNTQAPLDAMSKLSDDMIDEAGSVDGLAIERQINHSYHADALAANAQNASMIGKLDQILKAIERGQILTINGDTLVGATANAMNNALGQRRMLVERGAV
jgi:phage-related minor tail protein